MQGPKNSDVWSNMHSAHWIGVAAASAAAIFGFSGSLSWLPHAVSFPLLALAFLTGAFVGVAICAACLATALVQLTSPPLPNPLVALLPGACFALDARRALGSWMQRFPKEAEPAPGTNRRAAEPPDAALGLEARAASEPSPGSGSQPAARGRPTVTWEGAMKGDVFTLAATQWSRDAIFPQWPPTTKMAPLLRAWKASLEQGTLVLEAADGFDEKHSGAQVARSGTLDAAAPSAPFVGEDEAPAAEEPSDGQERTGPGENAPSPAASGGSPPSRCSPRAAPRRLGIPLEGCEVELVRDGLGGRSELLRRAPILVRHPRFALLGAERAFFLWAPDAAAKQAWAHALSWWGAGGAPARAAQAQFAAFNAARLRDMSACGAGGMRGLADGALAGAPGLVASGEAALETPEAPTTAPWAAKLGRTLLQGRGAGLGRMEAEAARGGRRWRTWVKKAGRALRRPELSAREGVVAGEAVGASNGPPALKEASIEVLMDSMWMRSVKAGGEGRMALQADAEDEAGRGAEHTPLASPAGSPPGSEHPAALDGDRAGTDGAAHPRAGDPDSPSSAGAGRDPEEAERGGAGASVSTPDAHAFVSSALPTLSAPHATPTPAPRPSAAATPAPRASAAATPAPLARAAPIPASRPSPPLEQGVNLLLLRLAYDAVRSPLFRDWALRRVRRQVSRMALPEAVHGLVVADLDLGACSPSVANLEALPRGAEEGVPFPLMRADVQFGGRVTLTLETRLDIRDAPAFGRFSKLVSRLEGGRGEGKLPGGALGDDEKKLADGASGDVEGKLADGALGCDDDEALAAQEQSAGDVQDSSLPSAHPSSPPSPALPAARRRLLGSLRSSAARKLRGLADSTAESLKSTPIRLKLTVTGLQGTVLLWMPPPPGNRIFYSFLSPPRLNLAAEPEIGGRLLHYSCHLARVSSFIESRARAAMARTLTFPACGEILVPTALALDSPHVADPLPPGDGSAAQAQYHERRRAEAGGGRSRRRGAGPEPPADKAGDGDAAREEELEEDVVGSVLEALSA